MKTTKRLIAMAAALTLTACAAAPMMNSFAVDETTGSITILNSAENHTYKAYQIFKGDLSGGTLSNIDWGAGVDSTGLINKVKEITLDTSIIVVKNGTATNKPFANVTDAESVAKVLSDGYYSDSEAETPTSFGADAEITKKFAEVIATQITSAPTTTLTMNSGKTGYEASSVKVGYYLVIDEANSNVTGKDDAYSRYIVEVLGTKNEVSKKTDKPQVIKKVSENIKTVTQAGTSGLNSNVTGQYNDVADYSFAENIPFELIGSMPSTIGDYKTYYYKFTDVYTLNQFNIVDGNNSNSLDAGDFVVTIGDTQIPSTVKNTDDDTKTHTNFTVTTNSTNDGFTIEFSDIKSVYASDATFTAGTKVAVASDTVVKATYNATLGSAAVVGLDGNENTVKLTYSNNPNHTGAGSTDNTHGETPVDTVIVFTYEQDVTKYLNNTNTPAEQGKAGFKLKRNKDNKWAVVDASGKITGWGAETDATEVKTASNGTFKFVGLDDGGYTLKETTTPAGYNTMADVTLTITATTNNVQTYKEVNDYNAASKVLTKLELNVAGDSNATDVTETNNLTSGIVAAQLINKSGSQLPTTGGTGTKVLYAIGGTILVGAGMVLVSKKRAQK